MLPIAPTTAPEPVAITDRPFYEQLGQRIAILAFGTLLHPCLAVAERLGLTVADMKFIKPLDAALACCLAHDGPFFLDVAVAPVEDCFPMIPAGAGHHEVLLAPRGRP